ncbi:hypothetical protein VPHD480_0018 [Vibrio phage D480]|nr:hypothetical protein MYOV011v1_p0185 [Vibrio phage 6E35.1a]
MNLIFERATLKTRKGSAVKRSKWGVGKDIGGALYLHINYVPEEFKERVAEARTLLSIENPTFCPNVVRIDYKKSTIAFYESTEFDHVQEPAAGKMIVVDVAERKVAKARQVNQIWHHKWLWVGDDYNGFNVSQSYDRSIQWLDHDDIPFTKIGSRKNWQDWLSSVNLTESLDRAAKVVYPKGNTPTKEGKPIFGLFEVGNQMYQVVLVPHGIQHDDSDDIDFDWEDNITVDTVEIHFHASVNGKWTYDITDSENAFTVFATVAQEAITFAHQYNCRKVVTATGDGNEKRKSLYTRIMRKLGAQEGYNLSVTSMSSDGTVYYELEK